MAEKNQRLFDLQDAVTQWAWSEYAETENRTQKRLRKKEEKNPGMYVGVQIDWSSVRIHDETKWPKLLETPFGSDQAAAAAKKTTDSDGTPVVPFADDNQNAKGDAGQGRILSDQMADASQRAEQGHTQCSTLFKTKFTNNTEDEQEYTMKTEKTTRSECTTEIENSWSKSFEMGINLKTPGEVFEANAGYSREVSLTNTEGQTFEEELCWGVESQIKVKPCHIAEASLVVNEKKYAGEFSVETTLQGYVYVSFTNRRDNNALVKATGHDIAEVVQWYLDRKRRIRTVFNYVRVENSIVKISTKGRCRFRFGINQEVRVDQKPISE